MGLEVSSSNKLETMNTLYFSDILASKLLFSSKIARLAMLIMSLLTLDA